MGKVIREREQPVAEVRFRARAHADDGAGFGETLRLIGVHVCRVHEAPMLIDAGIFQQPAHRTAFVSRQALVDFALLFRDMEVNRPACLAACLGDGGQGWRTDGAQAVRTDSDAEPVRLPGGRFVVVLEKLLEQQREKFLRPLGLRRVEPGTLVEYGHVGKADARLPRGLRQCLEHSHPRLFRSGVAVQVVKFDDCRIAALQHLRVNLPCDGAEQLRVEHGGQLVHALTPGPEAVASCRGALLGAAGQRSLEGVAVSVAQAGDDAARRDRPVVGHGTRQNLVDESVGNPQQNIVGPAVG